MALGCLGGTWWRGCPSWRYGGLWAAGARVDGVAPLRRSVASDAGPASALRPKSKRLSRAVDGRASRRAAAGRLDGCLRCRSRRLRGIGVADACLVAASVKHTRFLQGHRGQLLAGQRTPLLSISPSIAHLTQRKLLRKRFLPQQRQPSTAQHLAVKAPRRREPHKYHSEPQPWPPTPSTSSAT